MERLGIWKKWQPKKALAQHQAWLKQEIQKEFLWDLPPQDLMELFAGTVLTDNPLEFAGPLQSMHDWCTANAEALNVPGQEDAAWAWHRQGNGYWFAALKIQLAANNGFTLIKEWQPLLRLLLLGHLDEAKALVRAAEGLDVHHVYQDFWRTRHWTQMLSHRFALHLIYALLGEEYDGDSDNPEPLGVFAPLVHLVNHPDADLLVEPILNVLDWHTHETDDRRDGAEFRFKDFKIWPLEILALYRVREALGYTNPMSIDHPLMELPLSRLPPLAPMYKDEWTEQAIAAVAKLRKEPAPGFWQL